MAGIDIEPDMNGKAAVYAFQCPVFDHGRSAGGYFFSRLESQFDCTAEVFLHIVQDMSGGQHHGNMAVMAAGMHDTGIFTGKRKACFSVTVKASISPRRRMVLPGLLPLIVASTPVSSPQEPRVRRFIEFFFDYFTGMNFFFAEFPVS